MTEGLKVYEAINAVTAELGRDGIAKDSRNAQQGYNFRGIDSVYNALSPILARNRLCMLPRILAREVVERQSAKGGALFYVTVEAEFDLVSSEDGSKHTIRTFGEAMDSGDKATNKAMSAAYKYAAMQAFAIPTEGDNDADAVTHEVQYQEPVKRQSKANARPVDGEMRDEIDACQTVDELKVLWHSKPFQTEYQRHPKDWQDSLVEHFNEAIALLKKRPPQNGPMVPPDFFNMEPTQ